MQKLTAIEKVFENLRHLKECFEDIRLIFHLTRQFVSQLHGLMIRAIACKAASWGLIFSGLDQKFKKIWYLLFSTLRINKQPGLIMLFISKNYQ